jgi:hypothetical protein
MYTPDMATAFKSIVSPKNFGVVILDSHDFLTIQIDPKEILSIAEEDKASVVQYINDVKKTFEDLGAVVLIVREALED